MISLDDFIEWEVGGTVYFTDAAIEDFRRIVEEETENTEIPYQIQLNTTGDSLTPYATIVLEDHEYFLPFTIDSLEITSYEDGDDSGEVEFVLKDVHGEKYAWVYELPDDWSNHLFRLGSPLNSNIVDIVL